MTPRPIPAKVKRIIPALGSPVDAEALAACRAVGRTLAAASLDYHDLAAAIPTGEGQDNVTTLSADGPTWDAEAWGRVHPSRRKRYVFTPAQTAEHRRMALWVRNADAGRLSERERQFKGFHRAPHDGRQVFNWESRRRTHGGRDIQAVALKGDHS